MIIALVAGESSGDTLGEGLIKELKLRHPHAEFVGIGGPKMIAQGLTSWHPMESLSVMGIFEVLRHLPSLLRLRKNLISQLLAIKPDVFIGIDAPDFNFKVEKTLKQAGIKSIHYVGPSVWAWREKRLINIKKSVDGVLVLFPFEPPYYKKYGIPVKFVGHPLANEVPKIPDIKQTRDELNLPDDVLVIGLLPGSRMSEISLMASVYIDAAIQLRLIYPSAQFAIPCIHQKAYGVIEKLLTEKKASAFITLVLGQAQTVLAASNFVIVTSGTATLETDLMKRPMIISIKVHPFSYWLMSKLSTTKWIGLPNILSQSDLVPELIQLDATPQKIALTMGKLISDRKQIDAQLVAFEGHYHALKQNASILAANAIDEWALVK